MWSILVYVSFALLGSEIHPLNLSSCVVSVFCSFDCRFSRKPCFSSLVMCEGSHAGSQQDQLEAWVAEHNSLVSRLGSASREGRLEVREGLERLLTHLNSLPCPAMEVELCVVASLTALAWQGGQDRAVQGVLTSLARLVARHRPDLVLLPSPSLPSLLPHLAKPQLIALLSKHSLISLRSPQYLPPESEQ